MLPSLISIIIGPLFVLYSFSATAEKYQKALLTLNLLLIPLVVNSAAQTQNHLPLCSLYFP